MASSELEATFNTIVEAFLFFDKNGDGKLNKKDMMKALNESSPWEKSPAHITRTRFSKLASLSDFKFLFCSCNLQKGSVKILGFFIFIAYA